MHVIFLIYVKRCIKLKKMNKHFFPRLVYLKKSLLFFNDSDSNSNKSLIVGSSSVLQGFTFARKRLMKNRAANTRCVIAASL